MLASNITVHIIVQVDVEVLLQLCSLDMVVPDGTTGHESAVGCKNIELSLLHANRLHQQWNYIWEGDVWREFVVSVNKFHELLNWLIYVTKSTVLPSGHLMRSCLHG